MYRGDFALESTFDAKFTSRRFTTGAPFTLAGSPVVSAYVGNSTTQLTAGITLSVDFDGVTGLNNVRVVATAANGYAAGSNYDLVVTTGTVDSVSVVGEAVGSFSIEARSGLRPTVAARTLDVSATGEAGVDWANVGSPTTALNLSGTNIDVDQVVASVSGAVGSVTGAVGSIASGGIAAASFAAGAIDAAAIATDAIGSAELAAGAITEIQSGLATAAALATVQADTDDIQARLPAALVSGRIDASVGAMAANTLTATAIATDAIAASKLAADVTTELQTGLATAAALATVQADTDDLQTRLPAALVAGRMDVSVGALNGSTTAAQNLERSASSIYRGSITATSTSTSLIDSGLTQSGTDHWKGRVVIFTSGALAGQATDILAFTPASDALTVTALTAAPSTSDEFVIV